MKKKPSSQSAFFNFRVLFLLCSVGALLVLVAFGALPGGPTRPHPSVQAQTNGLSQAPTACAKTDRRASAIPATKLSGPYATAVFSLAGSRAGSAQQSAQQRE